MRATRCVLPALLGPLLGPLLLATGCANQLTEVQRSGFLEDYSQLRDAGDPLPVRWYAAPDVDFAAYTKVLLEPVVVWVPADPDTGEHMDQEARVRIARLLEEGIRRELLATHELVDRPGPNTLRLRLAVTEATQTQVVGATVSTLYPAGLVITEAIACATGERLFEGIAAVEAEARDSVTNQLLAAAMDRRQGGKDFGMTRWCHVEDHLDLWAKQVGRALGRTALRRAALGRAAESRHGEAPQAVALR